MMVYTEITERGYSERISCNGQPYHFTVCKGETAKEVAHATMKMGMNKFADQAPVIGGHGAGLGNLHFGMV